MAKEHKVYLKEGNTVSVRGGHITYGLRYIKVWDTWGSFKIPHKNVAFVESYWSD